MVYYQIIHNRSVKQMPSAHRILPSEWDSKRSTIIVPIDDTDRRDKIIHVANDIRMDIGRFNRIVAHFENDGRQYTPDDIVAAYKVYMKDYTLFSFMTEIIHKIKRSDRFRTAETYSSTLNSFRLFRADKDIMLDNISPGIIEDYESYLQRKGVVPNTISFYMRILRAVYNRAVDNGIIDDRKPFRHVYTGIGDTVKRALPLKFIRKIKALDLTGKPTVEFARNMFLLSFYLRGMSFIDMAFLRKIDLRNGYITYRRRKTKKLLSIKWTAEMQSILDKYPGYNDTPYLFSIIKSSDSPERNLYRNMAYNINRNLKIVARLAGITMNLTMYCARHSWASAAKTAGIPITVIRDGMGHRSETTTNIYLASLDTSAVDRANSLIIKRI